jgi:conjugative relaxase-like TrwC/TraI family protein
VVIFNITERETGQMRALQERSIFESQSFATAIYQSHLASQLRSLGYEIESGKSGAPEIKGYSQEYLDASRPRRQQNCRSSRPQWIQRPGGSAGIFAWTPVIA